MSDITVTAFWGVTIHLIVDWLLQNHWMATNKANPGHPAGYVHSGLHAVALALVFPAPYAIAIGVIHFLIDTRVPLIWWRKFYHRTQTGEVALHVAIWSDQVTHWAVICVAALVLGGDHA